MAAIGDLAARLSRQQKLALWTHAGLQIYKSRLVTDKKQIISNKNMAQAVRLYFNKYDTQNLKKSRRATWEILEGEKGREKFCILYSIGNRRKAPYTTKLQLWLPPPFYLYAETKFRFPSAKGAGNLLVPDPFPP